ncbi:MAG: hypothetical protein HN904_30450 [Victivallales bacterium]|nr:hypothetical protein [Victivallales bacterium]
MHMMIWRPVVRMVAVCVGLGFLSVLPVGEAAEGELPGWQRLVGCRKAEGNISFSYDWQATEGVEMLVRCRADGATATLVLDAERLAATIDRGEGSTVGRARTFTTVPPGHAAETNVTLKIRTTEWALYLNGALAATLPAPFALPGDVCIDEEQAEWVRSNPQFRPVPHEAFHSDFMIEEGAPNQLYPWQPQSGQWRIHTALDNALERPESNLARIKQVPLTADKSPNFYSLKGVGENAVITTGYSFFDDYDYAAAMQINAGEAGLVFYYRDAGNYYAFTIDMLDGKQNHGILRLWRVQGGGRTVLAQTKADLFPAQWYMPRVRAHTDEIVCLLDNYPVFTVAEPLPVGGKVGLFMSHDEETRFDDVYLSSYDRLPLRNAGEIRYQTLLADASFAEKGGLFGGEEADPAKAIRVGASDASRALILGRPHHEGIFFGAEFLTDAAAGEFGLVAGYRGPGEPFYRCVVHRQGEDETFRLERVTGADAEILDSWTRKRAGSGSPRLAVDATEAGWLRFLEDDQLVILHPVEGRLAGAAGIWVGADTSLGLRELRYDFERERNKEKAQENEVFAKDSFMRHWSSAEGQWLGDAKVANLFWHKGDFFSDFSITMPCIATSELHAGVPDSSTDGAVVVQVAKDKLTLRIALPGQKPEVYETPLVVPKGKRVRKLDYTLHHEGYWLWITVGGKRLLRHRLEGSLPGRRVLVKGLAKTTALTHLHRSLVTRVNVIDDFFSESPHNWLINGGRWQIVNRFQCTPSWSHMIGESVDTMAALWYKAVFEGDLTLEFYAGTRHGDWYQRMGDLNCTVMAETTTPSSGYTVTCTEWDQDLSQKWTSLRRNGKVLDRSDAYLVPRRRAGLVRKFLTPLVSAGRPYHGAWYYIKLRKIGNKLEYYFDNEKIFEETDPEMIQKGLVGIWTFMHSMTVAQVKITFDRMSPRAVSLLGPPPVPEAVAVPEPVDVVVNRFPLQALDPSLWSVDDPVGHTAIEPCPGVAPGLAVINRLGGGSMLAKPDLPVLELGKSAGWQFLLKRTPDAQLNVHYSVGVTDAKGTYTPQKQCVHRVSGDNFDGAGLVEAGRTLVPGSLASDLESGWHLVQVLVPEELRAPKLAARFEGLGTTGESSVLYGIEGNGPGAAYFLRQFSPLFYGAPELSAGETPVLFVLRDARHGREIVRSEDAKAVSKALAKFTTPGMNTAWLRVKYGDGDGYSRELSWTGLPTEVRWQASWHDSEPGAIVIRRLGEIPDPRFAGGAVALADGTVLPTTAPVPGELLARLPRTAAGMAGSEPLRLKVTVAGEATPISLAWKDRPVDDRPVLLGIKGLPGLCANFEKGIGTLSHTADARQVVQYGHPEQGRYLQVRNTALAQRLYASFGTSFPVSSFPVFQFRYRAYDMTYTSLTFSNSHYVRLSQDLATAVKVRGADGDLAADGNWHSWQGVVSDAFTRTPLAVTRFQPSYARFGSAHGVDQTGRYTKLDLDDVVFGPAVSQPKQLSFTPEFFDADGVEQVLVAVSPGAIPYAKLKEEQRGVLNWTSCPVGQPITPDLKALSADGLHHLLYKATDPDGTSSSVTDIPFLLDRKPLDVKFSFASTSSGDSNGLHAVVNLANHGGSPWAIGKSSFQVAGKARRAFAWSNFYAHSPQRDVLTLNYPLMMRSQLDQSTNGKTVTLRLRNIADGAGNASADLDIPYTINYAKDKTGPSWYWLKFGSSVHSFYNWDGSHNASLGFTPASYNPTSVTKGRGGSSFLSTQSYRRNGDLSRKVNWKPGVHPWLSCRIYLPKYRKGLRLLFTLATNRGNYTISTMAPSRAKSELGRGLKLPWARTWVPISANVGQLLQQAGVTPAKLRSLVVSTITISRRNCANHEPMYLDDFYLHGTPAAAAASNRMTWYAYDCSGVDKLEMACLGANGKAQWTHTATSRTVNLHQLAVKVKGCQWFLCRSRDKAGNLSTPFYLPIAGK